MLGQRLGIMGLGLRIRWGLAVSIIVGSVLPVGMIWWDLILRKLRLLRDLILRILRLLGVILRILKLLDVMLSIIRGIIFSLGMLHVRLGRP